MCGICGIYNFSSQNIDSIKIIKKINNLQKNRGPDGNNLWQSDCKKISLGHTRLSIIDLSNKADQPLMSRDRNFVITFNGEIYNYKEIRKLLFKKNIRLNSKSDTEIILESYKLWGIKFLNYLRGMFSFAIYDRQKKQVILARDPFGIKPLYFTKKNNVFYFASQIKSLLSINGLSFEKSEKGITSYYLWGNVQEPLTLYKDIQSVKRGNIKIINENGIEENYEYTNIKETILNSKADYFKSENEAIEKLKELILDTVKYHQVSDVPITLPLSAGIDSNVLLAAMNKDDKKKNLALTIDFDNNKKLNESVIAEKSASINNMEHSIKKINENEVLELINEYYKKMDSPTNDGLNTFLLSYYAKEKKSKIIISGIGADEFFFGYPSFKRIRVLNSFFNFFPIKFNGEKFLNFSLPIFKKLKLNTKFSGIFKYGSTIEKAFFLQRSLFLPKEIKEFLTPETFNNGLDELNILDQLKEDVKNFDDTNLATMYLENKYYLSSKILRDADWTSMANSIECRTPFIDWFFFKDLLPILKSNIKITKKSLVNCFKEKLPEVLYTRKKTGFNIPYKKYYENISNKKVSYSHPIKNWSKLNYEKYLTNE